MELYRLIEVYKDKKTGKTLGYKIKAEYNNNIEIVWHKELRKRMMMKEAVVDGLKLDRANRLIIDKDSECNYIKIYGTARKMNEQIDDKKHSKMIVYVGSELDNLLNYGRSVPRPRDCVKDVVKYCTNKKSGTLLMIHGLRRTGKTVCMHHAILLLARMGIDFNSIAFIEVKEPTEYNDLFEVVSNLNNDIVFIDEITNIINLANEAHTLVNSLPSKTIIVTGTESFALKLANMNSLAFRTEDIDMNMMTLREYERLFIEKKPTDLMSKYNVVQEFIKNGGTTMNKAYKTETKSKKEIENAIVKNIANTVNRNDTDEYSILKRLSNAQIELIVYSYIANAMNFKSEKQLREIEIQIKFGIEKFVKDMNSIDPKEMNKYTQGISAKQKELVRRALLEMGVVRNISNVDNGKMAMYSKLCCNIPVIYHKILEVAYKGFKNEAKYKGDIVENIVIQQCNAQLKDEYSISFLNQIGSNGKFIEIDIVLEREKEVQRIEDIGKAGNKEYILIEVKSDSKANTSYRKNFEDRKIIDRYGYDVKKIIIYFGENTEENYTVNGIEQTVQYINIYDFLMNIKKWIE